MVTRQAVDLLLITLCQSRPARLRAALTQSLIECPKKTGLKTAVILSPDRPTPAVRDVCHSWQDHPGVLYRPLPFPLVSPEGGQRWIEGRNWLLGEADAAGITARWQSNYDDDWQWGPGWDEHLPKMLNDDGVDAWEAVSLVLWDRLDDAGLDVNLRQYHWSPLIGRYQTGWRFDTRLTNQITKQCPGRRAEMPFFLLDFGTVSSTERRAMYRKYMRAGKTCNYVKRYVQTPIRKPLDWILKKFPDPAKFKAWQIERLLKEGILSNAKSTKHALPQGPRGT